MALTHEQAAKALKAIGDMIVDSIREGDRDGLGVSGGLLYTALMAHWSASANFRGLATSIGSPANHRRQH